MTEQPRDEINCYARLSPEAQALVDDHDQVALAELLVKAQDELAALRQVARGYCPQCGRGDAAPTVADWEQQKQRADRAEAELRRYTEAESADAAAGSYAGRAERVEAQLAHVRRLHRPVGVVAAAEFGEAPDCAACRRAWPCQTYNAVTEEHAIAQPEPWLHIAFTSPDPTTANTSALALADHLAAEFDGVSMRITTNAVEGRKGQQDALTLGDPQASSSDPVDNPADNRGAPAALRMRIAAAIHRYDNHHALSGNDIPSKHHPGEADFVLAELRPELASLASENTPDNPLEEQLRAAVESELYEYRERTMWWPETRGITEEIARLATRGAMEALQPKLAALAWTPPPPGDRREQLPDHLLDLIHIPTYTSTACEAAQALRAAAEFSSREVDELEQHADRLHTRCRLQNKFTGKPCICPCHPEQQL